MRLPLVDGQGNFGSVDGDPPAAMRYTEARLTAPALDILADLQKDTVDFIPNFDDSLEQPSVLPAAIPNLLVNGATGIAVGMSTSIPPHNLGEVVDACVHMLDNWARLDDINVEDLMGFVKGPDFPTGGIVLEPETEEAGLSAAYAKGKGAVTIQARASLEEMGRGRSRIIVTELPYMTNKASLIERIAKLARDGSLENISDLRDESDRQGMRIVIELSSKARPEKVLEKLYKRTQMRSTFSLIILALVNGEPTTLSLKQALFHYLEHRLEIVKRRSQHELDRAQARAHILEGLRIALANLDEIIQLIRKSQTVDTARENLMKQFKLSEVQAQAILDMPLRRLAALERKKIEDEYKDLQKRIKELEALLKSPKKMRGVVSEELVAVKEAYGDRRRTQIIEMGNGVDRADLLTASDIVPDANVWVAVHPNGNIARISEGKSPRPSGSAAPSLMVVGNTRDTLYLVADNGKAASIALHTIPEAESPEDGVHYTKLSPLKARDTLALIFSLPAPESRAAGWFVTTASRGGMVKKTEAAELPGPSSQTFRLAKVKTDDTLGWLAVSNGKSDLLLATREGMSIRFNEDDVRPMGLAATGVNGIKLKGSDQVVGFSVIDPEHEIVLVLNNGQAKRIKANEFPTQGRYGLGVQAWKLEQSEAVAGMAHDKPNQRITVHVNRLTAKSYRLDDVKPRKRAAKGMPLVDLADDQVTFLAVPWEVPSGVSGKPASTKPESAKKAAETDAVQTEMDLAQPDEKKSIASEKASSKKTPAKKAAAKKKAASKKNAAKKKTKK